MEDVYAHARCMRVNGGQGHQVIRAARRGDHVYEGELQNYGGCIRACALHEDQATR